MSRIVLKHSYSTKLASSGILEGVSDYESFEANLEKSLPMITDGREKGYFFESFAEAVLNLEYREVIPDSSLAEDGRDGLIFLNGQSIPYQVKYRGYDSRSDLTWDELSTFLAIDGINNALVVTNLDGLNHKCQKNIGSRKIAVFGRNQFLKLTPEDFDSIRAMFATQEVVQKLHEPMPHQLEAIQAARTNLLAGKNRGKFNMYCGTGKTATFSWILKDNDSKKSVLFFPNIELLGQTYYSMRNSSLGREYMNDSACLFVCCKKDVLHNKDEEASDYSNIIITTEPHEITKFLSENREKRIFVFATYHSSELFASNCGETIFDFGVFDEAHNTVGVEDKLYSYCLKDDNIKIAKRLFFTATEKTIVSSKRSKDKILYSMDDVSIYGDSWYVLNQKQAVERKIIAPVKTIISIIKDGSFNRNALNKSTTQFKQSSYKSSSLAFLETYKNAHEKYGFTHSLSFSPTIAHSKSVEQILNHYFGDDCFSRHIDASMRTRKRNEIAKSFSDSKHGVISNVKIYSEGKDSPKCDSILLLGKSQSVSALRQRIGRAQRLNGQLDKVAYVIVPIFVENEEDEKKVFAAQGFGALWQVLESSAIEAQEMIDVINKMAGISGVEIKTIGRNLISRMLDIANITIDSDIDYSILRDSILEKTVRLGFVEWASWDKAKEFGRTCGVKNIKDWMQLCRDGRKPINVPTAPDTIYPEWKSWPDFLNSGNVVPDRSRDTSLFLSKEEAIKYCRRNGINDKHKYKKAYQDTTFLPQNPCQHYKMKPSELFGTEPRATKFQRKTLEEHIQFAKDNNIKSSREWSKKAKNGLIPFGYAKWPNKIFKGRVTEIFGTAINKETSENFMTYEEARRMMIDIGLKTSTDFKLWKQSGARSQNFPSNPSSTYKNKGWISWPHFLGKENFTETPVSPCVPQENL